VWTENERFSAGVIGAVLRSGMIHLSNISL